MRKNAVVTVFYDMRISNYWNRRTFPMGIAGFVKSVKNLVTQDMADLARQLVRGVMNVGIKQVKKNFILEYL